MNVRHKLTINQLMMPNQANIAGNVHGGEIMKYMDMVAEAVAKKFCKSNVVTARVDEIQFILPIFVGALVSFSAYIVYVGRTSMEILVNVDAEDLESNTPPQRALSATFTMVCMGRNGRPQQCPEYIPETDDEKALYELAKTKKQNFKPAAQIYCENGNIVFK